MRKPFKILVYVVLAIFILWVLSYRSFPKTINYGVSFSVLHAEELRLDWKEAYTAILDDLGVKHLRLSAHWPMVEPKRGEYNFDELDYQVSEANKRNADVILAVGRRLPGWPECHDPSWAKDMGQTEKQSELLEYIGGVVNRYKDSPNLRFWQVENEPFLNFAYEYCGSLDEQFLVKEVDLVKKLDPNHKVITTDSGEFGKWYKARRYGDLFGTTMYLYVWHDVIGPVRYPISPEFFRLKQNLFDLVSGKKQTILIELGAEPWLTKSIVDAPIELQLDRMGIDKFKEVVEFNKYTGFSDQYLWGAEWWYWIKNHGHPEFWEEAKNIFSGEKVK